MGGTTVDGAIDTLSPVRELRPVRAGRFLVPKVPNPRIRASSPFARDSPITSNTSSPASFAAGLQFRTKQTRGQPKLADQHKALRVLPWGFGVLAGIPCLRQRARLG